MAETWCETNKECLKNRLQLAEAIGVKKRDSEGVIREFEAGQSAEFPRNGVVGPLSVSDVHRCVLHAMESLLMEKEARHLPGHPKAHVLRHAPILSAYRDELYKNRSSGKTDSQ